MEKVAYKELISAVAELSGKTKSQTQDVLDEFVQFTLATTKSGQGVSVSKLGTFAPKSRGGYTGHNPPPERMSRSRQNVRSRLRNPRRCGVYRCSPT